MSKEPILNDKILFFISIILWVISLPLVGFKYGTDIMYGWLILAVGLPLGWLVLAIQVYSNITYFISLILIIRNKNPLGLMIFTFILGLSAFFMAEYGTANESQTTFVEVDFWGWGSIFWISSYFVLLLLCFRDKFRQYNKIISGLLWFVPFVWLGIFGIGQYQLSHQSEEQRQKIFETKGLAISKSAYAFSTR